MTGLPTEVIEIFPHYTPAFTLYEFPLALVSTGFRDHVYLARTIRIGTRARFYAMHDSFVHWKRTRRRPRPRRNSWVRRTTRYAEERPIMIF